MYGNTIYGFTGTQDGMTTEQFEVVSAILNNCFTEGDEFHHGDCIGSDAQASDNAFAIGYQVHIHPCTIRDKRAFCTGHVFYPVLPPLVRNEIIGNKCERLIATPNDLEINRSGTWHTVRYVRTLKKPIHIIYPDGKLVNENV